MNNLSLNTEYLTLIFNIIENLVQKPSELFLTLENGNMYLCLYSTLRTLMPRYNTYYFCSLRVEERPLFNRKYCIELQRLQSKT